MTLAKPHAIPADAENLHHSGRFTVGDVIRSYDFHGRRDCYVEGRVVNPFCVRNGVQFYETVVTRKISAGKDVYVHPGEMGYFPHGVFFAEYDERIEKVAA